MTDKLKEEYVREAAYFIWEKEGRPETDGYEFWMRAIRQLSAQKAKASKLAPAKKTIVAKAATKSAPTKKAVLAKPAASHIVKKVAFKVSAPKPAVTLATKKK